MESNNHPSSSALFESVKYFNAFEDLSSKHEMIACRCKHMRVVFIVNVNTHDYGFFIFFLTYKVMYEIRLLTIYYEKHDMKTW